MKALRLLTTLAGCGLAGAIMVTPHAAFMIFIVIVGLVLWVLSSFIPVSDSRSELKPRALQLGLWIVTVAIAIALQQRYAADAREAGDQYAMTIEKYKAEHGFYPANLKAAGLEKKANEPLYYSMQDGGKPGLYYLSTYDIDNYYTYDFEHRAWSDSRDDLDDH